MVLDINLHRHAIKALLFNQPAMSVLGIFFSVLKAIGEDKHVAGYADAVGLKLFLKTIKPAIATLAILVIVKIELLTLALLYFPLVLQVSLLVLASKCPHTFES